MKKKRISFKYYGNTNLKPSTGGYYPIYVRVNYNRKNTQFPFSYTLHKNVMVEPPKDKKGKRPKLHLVEFSEEDRSRLGVDQFENTIETIVRYEEQKFPDDSYSLKGLSDRFRFYVYDELVIHVGHKLADLAKTKLSSSPFEAAIRHLHYIQFALLTPALPLMEKESPGVIDFLKEDKTIYLAFSIIVTLNILSSLGYTGYEKSTSLLWYSFRFGGYDKKYIELIKTWNEKDYPESLTNAEKKYLEEILEFIPQFPPTEEFDAYDYLKFLEDLAYDHLGIYL